MISYGHRKLGVIAGLRDGNDRAQDRILGIQDAIDAHPGVQLLGLQECKYSFEEAGSALDDCYRAPFIQPPLYAEVMSWPWAPCCAPAT